MLATSPAVEMLMTRSVNRASMQPHATPRSVVVRSTIEREIKLAVDDHFRLPHLAGTPLPRRLLTSTYYDTPGCHLTRAGITLRYRVARRTAAWQLKLPLIKDRQELEIVGRQPVPPKTFRDLLLLHLGHRRLMPVVTLRTRRTGVRVHQDNLPIADVTHDDVAIVKNGTVIQRFRELEIEQLNGNDGTLHGVERQLRRAGAEEHDGRPKLFRALSLPAPGADGPPGPKAPAAEHVTWALTHHVRWLLAHDPGTRFGREPESLHQMRIATRQLRALLHAAKPLLVSDWADSLQKELAWLLRLLGPARDLDVQLAYFRDEATRLDARDRKPLSRFIEHLVSRRANVQEKLLTELRSARYLRLIRRLREATEEPAIVASAVTVRDLAAREFKRLRKAIRGMGTSPSSVTVHKVRIGTKRARYIAALAEPGIGKPATRFIKQARAVQDVLGMHQDAIQAEAHVRTFLKQSTSVRTGFIAGRMVERQRERREQARKAMRKLWKGLLKRGKQAWG